MKKFFTMFFVLLLVIFLLPVNAQVRLGLQGGVNLADVDADPLPSGWETSMRTDFLVGGILNYNFSPILSLQVEPAYIRKGAAIDGSTIDIFNPIKFEGTYSADYIDVPVLLKASFGNGQVKPFLLAGASVAFLLGDLEFTIDKATLTNGQDVTNQIPSNEKEHTIKGKDTDFILNFGGGVTIPVGLVEIFIEGLYNLGLTNVNDQPSEHREIKARGIQIKVGAIFPR